MDYFKGGGGEGAEGLELGGGGRKMWGYFRRKAAGPRLRWRRWERRVGGGGKDEDLYRDDLEEVLVLVHQLLEGGVTGPEATYWADVVFVRRRAVAEGMIFFTIWTCI
ncbi:mechanosensitive channel of smallconductance-like 10 [Striga asiatica]|uniref:Mechanosensitive channel of smallconductance-like 10 n=1 Tax=Striga asiatica TaxID=4170 RepID=A0A5A7P4X5_STRAF|nr:mechanosensitive channel of smallconductance-like 10 [Striga asiatica]